MFGGSKPSFGVNTTAPGTFGFNNTTAASPFGQSSFAKPATSGFGQAPTFGQQNTSLFGGGQQTTGLFGGNQQQPAFGTNIATTQQSGFGGFVQQQQNAPLFGSPQANTSLFSTSGFGANKPAPFGATQNTSLFGAANAPQTVTTGIFGSPPPTGGLFGNNQAPFGGATGSSGTAVVKYQPSHGTDTLLKSGNTTNINTKQHCITAMKEYEGKSLEELRLEDYLDNRKGGAQVGQTTSLFGPQPTNTGLVFGQPQAGGIFAQQDNKNVFGSQAPTGFNQTATGFGQAGQQTSIFNKTFQGNPATTSTFGGFNNTTATANNPFGQKPFGQTSTSLFGQTQPPTSTTSTFGNSSFFGTTQQQPQQGTSFFGNTDNKSFALPGIQQSTQPNAFGSFGTAQPQPAQNQQPFGMAKPTNNFSFNTPTSQQNNMGNTGFPGFGQQNTTGGLFNSNTNNNNAFGTKLQTPNFGFTSQPNQPLMSGGVGGISLGTSGGTSFFNTNANKPGGLFGNTNNQPGGLFGNNTFGNGNSLGGFGTSNLGNNGLGTSTAPATYPVHQQIMALTSSPYGDSAIFKDLKSSGMSDDALKATNPAAQKAILETKSNQYKVSPKPTTSIKTKPVVGMLSKKSLFDGLEEHDSTIEENFNLAVNPRRLIIKKKNRNNLNISSADSNNDGSPLSTPQSSVPNTPKLPLEGRMSLQSNVSLTGNDVRDDFNNDIQKNPIMNPDSESTRRESWLNINGLEKIKQINRISELSPSASDNTLLEFKSSDTNRMSDKISALQNTSSESLNPLGLAPGGTRGSPGRFAAQTSSDSLILNTSFVNESISTNDVNQNYEPHPTGIVLTRSGYYTIPSLDEISTYLKDDGTCIVPNFAVGRKGYGNVYFNEPINVAGMNLDEIVFFRNKEVTIYPDDDTKPAQGEGLNRKAQITLDQVWPIDKTVHEPIKDPERLTEMDYEGKLRRVCDKHDTKFIEYRPETGSWVFRVNHFSKYGLLSDSDEEDSVPTDAKKAKILKKTTGTIPKTTVALAADVQKDNTGLFQNDANGKLFNMEQENIDIDFNKNMSETRTMYMPISPTTDIARDIGADSHKIQLMKASFFIDDNYDRRSTFSEYGGRESPDQIVPTKALFSSKDFENIVPQSRLNDFMEHEITSKDVTVMSSYRSKEKLNVFEEDKLREDESPEVNRIVIVKPKISIVKLPNTIVPLKDSIFAQLKGHYIADVGFMHGRQYRVGWGIQNSLIIMNTKHNIETNTKLIPHQIFKGRGDNDTSSCLLQHIKISSFDKNIDRKFFDSIAKHLEIELKYATFHFENKEKNCPYIQSNGGTLSIEDHYDAAESVAHYDDFSDYKNSVYSLIRVLWGDREELENQEPTNHSTIMCRRNLLSEWLEQNTLNTRIEVDSKSSGYLEALWDLIMSHKITDACELAFQNDDINLSLLLAQISGGPAVRQLIDHQLSSWQYVQADKFIAQERLKMFQLIANVPVLDSSHGVLNVFDNLNWINVIALYIWYLLTPTASLTEALVNYEKAFESEKFYAAPPRPYYAENNLKTNISVNSYDLRFHLIRLYSRRNYPLEPLLNPSTYTSDPMDYRLSWLILQTLESLGYNHCSELSESQIHLSLANQLESHGLWQWAVFVLLHIKDESRRELCIQNLLYKYISLSDEEDYLEKENFIQMKLKISEKWIFWAKAVKAGSQKAYHDQAKYLLKAKQWSLAHEVIMAHIVPDAIMNDDIKYIKELLGVFEDSRQISSWLIQGQVILDYIDMVEKFENLKSVPETDLETYWDALKPQLGDLCSRIMLFPCPTSKHRLCQSEIAQKLACLIRGILITKDVNPCLVIKMALEKLPLPQEYAQQELRVLLDTYFTDTNNLMEC